MTVKQRIVHGVIYAALIGVVIALADAVHLQSGWAVIAGVLVTVVTDIVGELINGRVVKL